MFILVKPINKSFIWSFKPLDIWALVSLFKKQLVLIGQYKIYGDCCGKNVRSKGTARFTAGENNCTTLALFSYVI